jgi:hypothetical protein
MYGAGVRPCRLPRPLCLAAIAAGLLTATSGHAQADAAPTVELSYAAPSGCPEAARVEREILRLLAGSRAPDVVRIEIVVVRSGPNFEAQLRLHEPVTGERSISHSSCTSALRAAALIVAISIDPDAMVREQTRSEPSALAEGSEVAEQAASEPSEQERRAAPATPESSPSADTDPAESTWDDFDLPSSETTPTPSVWLMAGALGERGLAPEIAMGPVLALGIQGKYWRLALRGAYLLPTEARAAQSSAGARFSFAWVDLALCARMPPQGGVQFSAGLCAFGRQAWAAAKGVGVDDSITANAQLQQIGGGPHLAFRLYDGFGLEGAFDVEWALQRPRFVVENVDSVVYRPPALGGALRLGATLEL